MNRKNPAGGFTLVETIFSTLFISLTVLAIVNLFPGAYMSVKKSEVQLQSDFLATSILEEMRTVSWSSLKAAAGTSGGEYTNPGPLFLDQTIDGLTYYPKVFVTPGANDHYLGVKVEIWLRVGETYRVYANAHEKPVVVQETYFHSLEQ